MLGVTTHWSAHEMPAQNWIVDIIQSTPQEATCIEKWASVKDRGRIIIPNKPKGITHKPRIGKTVRLAGIEISEMR